MREEVLRLQKLETIKQKLINVTEEPIMLTQEEANLVTEIITDPLQDFCYQEGMFRLGEVYNLPDKQIEELASQAAQVVRNCIDYSERLYDEIDTALGEMLEELKKEEN